MLNKVERRRQGSALILVLWCLILLGMAVFGVVDMVELSVDSTSHRELVMEARALASTGIALGCSPQLQKDDPLLSQKPAPGHEYKVLIESAGSRLNLNYILQSNHREILVHLFTQWGLSMEDADHVADCLYDWQSPTTLRSLNGAKADEYAQANLPQRPTGQPFQSLDEVKQVIGMDLVEKIRPDWEDSFTLWSGGPLDLAEAPGDLIAAVFNLDPKRVGQFVAIRNGHDGIAGTADDVVVSDSRILQGYLGIGDETMKALGDQISFKDPIRHVKSIGQADGVQVIISVDTKLNSTPVQLLSWSER
jgi:hypothetical protein